VDVDGLERLWDESLGLLHLTQQKNELSLSDTISWNNDRILLSEPPFAAINNRVKMAEIVFCKYGMKAMYISPQGLLPLFAAGETSGTVVNCGAGHMYTTSTYDGQVISQHDIININIY